MLAFVAVAAIAAAVVTAWIAGSAVDASWAIPAAGVRVSMVLIPIAVGLYVWQSRPDNRFGPLLVAMGFGWFVTTFAESGDELLSSIGRTFGWLVQVGLVWLMLAFPAGRLATTLDRALVWSAGGLLLLYIPVIPIVESYPVPSPYTSCHGECPKNAFFVLDSQPGIVDSLVVPLRELLTITLFTAVAARLGGRLRRASNLMRRTLAPVLSVAIVQCVFIAIGLGTRMAIPESPVVEVFVWGIALTVPALAIAFFVGLVRRRIYVGDALRRLAMLARGRLAPDELRAALAAALDDPSLALVFWANRTAGGWVDEQGRPVMPPPRDSPRCLTEIHDRDRLVAGVVHDASLREESTFIRAVASFALSAIEYRRMAAKVASSMREVHASRARVVAGADRERRRIERDLHDGAQQRLVALRIQLKLLEESAGGDPEVVRPKLHALGEAVNVALEEIRTLAHGVFPPLLADRGLGDALRGAALDLPAPATVTASHMRRYPAEVEAAVYFCCLEAMQNASKHAEGAKAVAIRLEDVGDAVRFQIRDDGAGFDTAARRACIGLTNMRDRMAAVEGELEIRSAPGAGTLVAGQVPLGGWSGAAPNEWSGVQRHSTRDAGPSTRAGGLTRAGASTRAELSRRAWEPP